jgi:hypothetical protein
MADSNSDQMAKLALGKNLDGNEKGSAERIVYFEKTVPAGNLAIADRIPMFTVPKGARILGGRVCGEAMSTGGAAASGRIGDGTTSNKYLDDTSFDAIAQADFANTLALGYGTVLAADTTFYMTVVTEAWLAGKKLAGHLRYVENY